MREFSGNNIPKPKVPFDSNQRDSSRPLDLEIGAGQGLHAIAHAMAHPERDLVAVEKTHIRFARFLGRLEAHAQLPNLLALQADAVAFVFHYLPPSSVDRIYLLYPNPYLKAKQANLRWHNRPFLTHLLTKLKTGGQLTLASNLEWYVNEAMQRIPLKLISNDRIEASVVPRTHFEKKYLERGETCWNLVFSKVDACNNSAAPVV